MTLEQGQEYTIYQQSVSNLSCVVHAKRKLSESNGAWLHEESQKSTHSAWELAGFVYLADAKRGPIILHRPLRRTTRGT